MVDRYLPDALRVPREQPIDEREVQRVRKDAFHQLSCHYAKRARFYRRVENGLIEHAHHRRRQVSQRVVLFLFVTPIDEIELALLYRVEQVRNLFRGMLQIVHRHDVVSGRIAKPHMTRVLTVVSHQLDCDDPVRARPLQIPQHLPRVIATSIVDKISSYWFPNLSSTAMRRATSSRNVFAALYRE